VGCCGNDHRNYPGMKGRKTAKIVSQKRPGDWKKQR
jgi:hypothetical protein